MIQSPFLPVAVPVPESPDKSSPVQSFLGVGIRLGTSVPPPGKKSLAFGWIARDFGLVFLVFLVFSPDSLVFLAVLVLVGDLLF